MRATTEPFRGASELDEHFDRHYAEVSIQPARVPNPASAKRKQGDSAPSPHTPKTAMAMGGHVGREGSPARTRVAEDEAGDDYDVRHAPKRGETMAAVSPQQQQAIEADAIAKQLRDKVERLERALHRKKT